MILSIKAGSRPDSREAHQLYSSLLFWFVRLMPRSLPHPLRGASVLVLLVAATTVLLPLRAAGQNDWSYYAQRAFKDYLSGDYAAAEEYCERIMSFGGDDPDLMRVFIDAMVAQGKYNEAAEVAATAAETFAGYFPIQVLAVETLRHAGKEEKAQTLLKELNQLAKDVNPKALNAVELTALGKAALLLGAEPKMVLTNFFQKARQLDVKVLDGHLAAAEIALAKSDYALASRILNQARGKLGSFPDLLYLLARAFSPSDRKKSESLIDDILESNPHHLPALLLRAEHAIDVEEYKRARELIASVHKINPHHPLAWAYEAAIAYLQDERAKGVEARTMALNPWAGNPEVDFVIGEKISQNRRFNEGAAFLRQALEANPNHLGAKKALGQNLLRLGKEQEGWALIKEVQAKDKFDVETYNLMLLHDELEKFVTLESEHFLVRMTTQEAKIYGPQVLDLLEDASRILGTKYGFLPEERVLVDFYPDQRDFAIRTLGIPGGLGILGASFGNVLVMNSPGGPGAMGTNWESTLWHEYCHTITLGATKSRIPRWLTEGISVYEERNRDPSCGHKMTPVFRRRILNEDDEEPGLIPIVVLSGALTNFNNPETIDFAYYQSSLLVEYLLEKYGAKNFQRVLSDLKTNAAAEKVLAERMANLDTLDQGFAKFARARARKVAPKADWELPAPDSPLHRDPEGVARYLQDNPNNIWALSTHCRYLLADKKWKEAKAPAKRLIKLYPEFIGAGNGYACLAQACRNLEEFDEERTSLRAWSKRDGDASQALDRLIELDLEKQDWSAVEEDARRLLAVNPLLRSPHRALAVSAQAQGRRPEAIRAFESLLHLDPVNPADVHFRLGQLYAEDHDDATATRHVLAAIEEAPRFREAHQLLLHLKPSPRSAPAPTPEPVPDPAAVPPAAPGSPQPEKPEAP